MGLAMDEFFLSAELGGSTVCVSPLTKQAYLAAGGKGMGGDFGYFIYEYETTNQRAGIEILAKAKSVETAIKLFNMLSGQKIAA